MAEVGNSAVKPALGDFVHPRAHLVVGVGKLARVPELADHRPVVGADRVRLARAVRVSVVDPDSPAFPADDTRRHIKFRR